MKGLFIKDCMLAKKNFLYMVLFIIGAGAFSILIYLSYVYGNLSAASDVINTKYMVMIISLLVGLISGQMSNVVTSIFEQDIASDFAKVSIILPINDKQRTGEKYLIYLASLIISSFLGIVMMTILGIVAKVSVVDDAYKPYMLALFFSVVLDCVSITVSYFKGTKATVVVKMGIIILLMLYLTKIMSEAEPQSVSRIFNLVINNSFLLMAVAICVCMPLSYALSLRIVSSRRNKVW